MAESGLSLLLFAASAALCIRSQFRCDTIDIVKSWEPFAVAAPAPWWAKGEIWYDQRTAHTDPGGLLFRHDRLVAFALGGQLPARGWYYGAESSEKRRVPLWPTYQCTGTFVPPPQPKPSLVPGFRGSATLALPHWLLLCVFGIPPSVATARAIRKRRHPAGTCRNCGYDLRTTAERCPECGTPVARKRVVA